MGACSGIAVPGSPVVPWMISRRPSAGISPSSREDSPSARSDSRRGVSVSRMKFVRLIFRPTQGRRWGIGRWICESTCCITSSSSSWIASRVRHDVGL